MLQLGDLGVTGVQLGLCAQRGGVFQVAFSSAQCDGLLGHFNTLVGQVGQLVDLLLVFAVHVGFVSLVQPVLGVLGFKGSHFAGLRIALQGREVGASRFQVGVRVVRAGSETDAQGQEGGNHDVFAHSVHPLIECEG